MVGGYAQTASNTVSPFTSGMHALVAAPSVPKPHRVVTLLSITNPCRRRAPRAARRMRGAVRSTRAFWLLRTAVVSPRCACAASLTRDVCL